LLCKLGDLDDEYILKSGESLNGSIILSEEKENNLSRWNNIKYPVKNPNLSDFDLELKIYTSSLFLKGKKIEMPKIKIKDIDTE
jgi:hypothetical protein